MRARHPLDRDRNHSHALFELREGFHEVFVGVFAVKDDRVGAVERGADVPVAQAVENPLDELRRGPAALVAGHALEPGVQAHDQRLVEPAADVGESLVRRADPAGKEAEFVLNVDEIGPGAIHPANQIGEVAVHLAGRDPPVAVNEVLHVEGEDIGKPLESDGQSLRVLGIAALLIPRSHQRDRQPRGAGAGGNRLGRNCCRGAAARRIRINQGRVADCHGLSLRTILPLKAC